ARVVTTTRELTGVLVSQEESIRALTTQSEVVVTVLTQRREALSSLVTSLDQLAEQVSDLLRSESEDVDRLLANMRSISETYRRNIDVMDEVLTRMPPGLRAVADATGNGPWTDVATPTGPIPDSALCALGVMDGCNCVGSGSCRCSSWRWPPPSCWPTCSRAHAAATTGCGWWPSSPPPTASTRARRCGSWASRWGSSRRWSPPAGSPACTSPSTPARPCPRTWARW